MKRPLVLFSFAALSGVLFGLPESGALYRAVSIILAFAFYIGRYIRMHSRGERSSPLFFLFLITLLIFFSAYFRANSVRSQFDKCSDFFREYEATNPGQFDYALYLKGEGIDSAEKLDEKYNGYRGEAPLKRLMSSIRDGLSSMIDRYMAKEDAGIYKALLLGDKKDMDDQIKDLYQASGISHIIAVSGMHISLMGMSVFKLLSALKARRGPALIASSAAALFYAVLTGASGSAMRAVIMLFCRFLAMARSRSYDMVSSIALALLILVFERPYIVFQSGFQLSFLAVAGISVVGNELTAAIESFRVNLGRPGDVMMRKYTDRESRLSSLWRIVISNLSVQLATLPAIAYHFFVFPIYGILLNFIVIPLMDLVMYSGLAVLLAGAIADMTGLQFFAAAAVALGGAGHYILRLYEILCELSMKLPLSSIVLGRPDGIHIFFYYCLIFLIIGGFRFLIKNGIVLRQGGKAAAVCCMLFSALLLSSTCLLYKRKEETDGGLVITALDVGQGDCFLVRCGDKACLLDGGSSSESSVGEDVVENCLLTLGIRELDAVFVSHADEDHISAIEYMLSADGNIAIKRLILPAAARENEEYEELKMLFSERTGDSRTEYSDEGFCITMDKAYLKCIFAGAGGEDINRHSPVYLLGHGAFTMLFTGDMTEDEEKGFHIRNAGLRDKYYPYGVTVLKVAHHGSSSSSSDPMLKAVRPAYALISYGRDNPFGHPHPSVTGRLERYGAEILSTGELGAVTISTDGEYISINTFLDGEAEQEQGKQGDERGKISR